MIRTLLCGTAAVCLLATTACYNKPETSLKKPGEGPANLHAGPSVGPGTTAGGSTAGPQPVKHDAGGHGTKAEDASKVDTSRGHGGGAASPTGAAAGEHTPAAAKPH
jgi:hypothetical protein